MGGIEQFMTAVNVGNAPGGVVLCAKKLKSAGVPEQQAEIQAETLAEIVEERLRERHVFDLSVAAKQPRMNGVTGGRDMLNGYPKYQRTVQRWSL
jgi:hypothetical protein